MSAVIFDFQALAKNADSRDAELLHLIDRFNALASESTALMRRAERVKEDGRRYRQLWREVRSTYDEQCRLEREICTMKARSRVGIVAKMNLFLERFADNSGTMWDLPKAAVREALAMMEGTGS